MKNDYFPERMAQGAAAWREREAHEAMLKKLNAIDYTSEWIPLDRFGEPGYTKYSVNTLTENEMCEIVRRGNSDEIMLMIERYNRLLGCPDLGVHTCGYLPASVQVLIVSRHTQSEIDAVTEHYGFCAEAQKVMFEQWAHEDLVAYAQKHGFCDECQKIMLRTWSHAELFAYAQKHSFNEDGEESVLQVWSSDEVRNYIEHHGLSEKAQQLLLKRGNHEEIMFFLSVRCLEGPACLALILRGRHDEIMTFLNAPKTVSCSKEVFDAVLKRADHDEIALVAGMLSSYNFDEQRQQKIFVRGDAEELQRMFYNVDAAPLVAEQLLENAQTGKNNDILELFAKHSRNGFSYDQQKIFIETADSSAFCVYVECRTFKKKYDYSERRTFDAGLDALVISERSDEDIRFYLQKHIKISAEAEVVLAGKKDRESKFFYAQRTDSKNFIFALLKQPEPDYELISDIFMAASVHSSAKDEPEIELMRSGTPDKVRAYFEEKVLCRKAFLTLFYRMDKTLLEAYLETHKEFYR